MAMKARPMTTEVKHRSLWWSVVAEFFANFYVYFMGMACLIMGGAEDVLTIGLCFTFVVFSITVIFGHSSGAHLNPIVSAGMTFTRQMTPVAATLYFVAQFLGNLVAAKVLHLLLNHPDETISVDHISGGDVQHKVTLALVLGGLRVFVYISAFNPAKEQTTIHAFSIASTVGLAELVMIPISGSSGINPARSLAFALCSTNDFAELWIFITVPFIGGMFAALVYPFVFAADDFLVKEEVQPLIHNDHDPENEQP